MTATTASGTTTHPATPTTPARATAARTATYGRHLSGILAVAFTLSAVHTVYAWVEGIEDPTFTVTTPLAWAFYVVGFGSAVLARRTGSGRPGVAARVPRCAAGDLGLLLPDDLRGAAADDVRLVRERRVRRAAPHGYLPRRSAAAAGHADAGVKRPGWGLTHSWPYASSRISSYASMYWLTPLSTSSTTVTSCSPDRPRSRSSARSGTSLTSRRRRFCSASDSS